VLQRIAAVLPPLVYPFSSSLVVGFLGTAASLPGYACYLAQLSCGHFRMLLQHGPGISNACTRLNPASLACLTRLTAGFGGAPPFAGEAFFASLSIAPAIAPATAK